MYLHSALMLVASWFVATIFIDFFAVPNVFRTVSSRDEASSLGVIIFSKFNLFELIFALLISLTIFKDYVKNNGKKVLLSFSFLLLIFPALYNFQYSPMIKKNNELKIQNGEDETVQANLDFYHKLYVRTDAVKLFILLYVLVHGNIILAKREE